MEIVPDRQPSARPHGRCWAGLAAGPCLFALVLLWPLPGLGGAAHRTAAVFAWTVAWWVTEALPLPVTALTSSLLAIVLGVAPARTVLAAYADPVIFVFVGSFMLAEAVKQTGLDRRFALGLLHQRWASRTPARLLLAVGTITCVLSLWMSNTATTALMLPIGLGLLRALGAVHNTTGRRYAIGLLLMLAWASSVAVGVPVGSPPNLIAIGMLRDLAGRRFTFFDWTAVTLPLTVLMLLLCWGLLATRYRDPALVRADLETWPGAARGEPWTPAQVHVLAVFALAASLWMLPGALATVAPEHPVGRALETHLPEAAVALLAAVLLFVRTPGGRTGAPLTWRNAAAIDWGTILLFGGGLALGRLAFETGLAERAGSAALAHLGLGDLWVLTGAAIVVGVLLSETASNTASASMLIPVVIAVARSAGVSPIPPVLGAALGASFGFMLPVSTPPNAIIYGSGLVPLREMIRAGLALDLSGAILIWVGLRTLCPLLGMG